MPSGPPTRVSPEARAISTTAVPSACMRHSAVDGIAQGPAHGGGPDRPAEGLERPLAAVGHRARRRTPSRRRSPPARCPPPPLPRSPFPGTCRARRPVGGLLDGGTGQGHRVIVAHGRRPFLRQRPSVPSASVVVVSNRGPLSFSLGDDGELEAGRGGGGLVSSLGPLVKEAGATWIAAAITDADRQAAEEGVVEAEGFKVRSLAIDPSTFRMAYDVVSNSTLWFLNHGLFDLARRPRFDRRWWEAWDGYRAVNRSVRRGGRRARRGGRHRPRPGLPPVPGGGLAGPGAARPAGGALHPHALRRPRGPAGAAVVGGRGAARGHDQPRRLRLPRPPVGRQLRGVLP